MEFDGPDGYAVAAEAWADAWTPRKPQGVADWAQENRRLSGKSAAEPGPWRNERIPFLRGVMDALDDRHPAQIVVFEKSAQVGGSECGLNWVGWTIDQSPAPMLALLPTEKLGNRWVRGRLHPMIAETPPIRRKVPLGRKSDAGNTLQEKHFDGGVLYVGSANIPSDLSSVPVARLLLDEVDRMPRMIEDEGDPVEIAKRRVATFQGRNKVFEISTPTDEGSRIDADYAESSGGRYFVPCPHCGTHQVLRWGNLVYDAKRPKEGAWYRCDECAALIEEHSKTDMLARGEWRHERPELCESVIGFHVNCLYTPIGLGDSWAENASAFVKARRDPAKLQAFTNTRLGEVHHGASIRIEPETLRRRAEPYRLRTIPPGVLLLTAGADVQHDRIEAQILGWGRDERLTVIDYAVIPGSPVGDEVYRKLDEYLAATFLNTFGVEMRISAALVDSGNWQHEVTNFTRDLRLRNVFASKGSTILARPPIGRPTHVEVKYRGKTDKRGAEQYQIGVHVLKNSLFSRLRADAGTPDEPVLPVDRSVRFSVDLNDEYFDQLTAEKFDAVKGRYVNVRERNEALDTMILAMAAGMHHNVAVHRMRELDWQRLEDLYEAKGGPVARVAVPELGKVPIPTTRGGFLPTVANVQRGDD